MTVLYRSKRNYPRFFTNVKETRHCSDRQHHGIDVIIFDDGSSRHIRTDYNMYIGLCRFLQPVTILNERNNPGQ